MNLNDYVLVKNKTSKHDFICSICLDDNCRDLLTQIDCKHTFHKDCIIKHIASKIEQKSEKIYCPFTNCKTEISDGTIYDLINFNSELTLEFFRNIISYDNDYCICNKCKTTYCKMKNNKFIDYCPICEINHCFQCGKIHDKNVYCFEIDEESKNQIAEFYKNTKYILKTCPHCSLPQEKQSGCHYMTCGSNSHDDELRIHGCGKKFNWIEALVYNQNSDIENYDKNVKNTEELLTTDETYMFYAFNSMSIVLIYLILTFMSIYLLINITNIESESNNKMKNYCNKKFNMVDNNFINTTCLHNYNLTHYEDCYNDLFCWNNGDNIYNNLCFDNNAYYHNEKCNLYNNFIKHHTIFYYCNNVPKYEDIYLCEKNMSFYYIILITLWTMCLSLMYTLTNVGIRVSNGIRFVNVYEFIKCFFGYFIRSFTIGSIICIILLIPVFI